MGEVIWITGQMGSGKTTTLKKMAGKDTILLDGDELRKIWPGLTLTREDRWEQNLRAARLAKLLADQGFIVIVATIAPYETLRKEIKNITGCTFIWVDHNEYPDQNHPYEEAWDAEIVIRRKLDEKALEIGKPIPRNSEGAHHE